VNGRLAKAGLVIALFALFAGLTLLFFPKERLVYLLTGRLAREGVTLCFKEISCGLTGCRLRGVTVLTRGVPVAKIQNVSMGIDRVTLRSVLPVGTVAGMVKYRVDRAVFHPFSGTFEATGDFGSLQGRVDLLKRHIALTLIPSGRLRRGGELRGVMAFDGKRYRYESDF